MIYARKQLTASLLKNGLVLVAGGENRYDRTLFSAELYNPQTGNWTLISNMTYSRVHHTASILLNRTVLVAGVDENNGALSSAEMYYL